MNTVLIVEDERAILELVAFASEASGFHALKAGSVAEAKEKLSVEKPDIIVLDWMLPDCSGLEWFGNQMERPYHLDSSFLPLFLDQLQCVQSF